MKVLSSNPKHLINLRNKRSFYGKHDENTTIPESILISYKEDSYRIFITDYSKKCNLCSKYGHIETQCHTSQTHTIQERWFDGHNWYNTNNKPPKKKTIIKKKKQQQEFKLNEKYYSLKHNKKALQYSNDRFDQFNKTINKLRIGNQVELT